MRVLVVLFAYLISIIIGVVVYGIIGLALTDFEFARMFEFLTRYVTVFALALLFNLWLTPFALIGLASSEIFRVSSWWPYIVGGAVLGLLICAQRLPYETERPEFSEMLPFYSSVMLGAVVAGYTYWFIVWKRFPPMPHQMSETETSE